MKRKPTNAERILAGELSGLQAHVEGLCRGREKLAVIEVVRSLDGAAVSRLLRSEHASVEQRMAEHYALCGAAAALRPFLRAIRNDRSGVPWQRSSAKAAGFFDSYVIECGQLSDLLRMCKLEHYGLASTSVLDDRRIRIDVSSDVSERVSRMEMARWMDHRAERHLRDHPDDGFSERMMKRMLDYVDTDPDFFIRYDNDDEIVERYLGKARWVGSHFFEGEALPLMSRIGGRTFGDWKDACDQALGRVLFHMDFARLLCGKRPDTSLRDVLTIFARRSDVAAVWEESGMQSGRVESTVRALSLRYQDLDVWEMSYEQPTPMYVDLGKDFVLLPLFGSLSNPYYALFRHLRDTHRSEWDRIVDQRERIFRDELRNVLPPERFLVPASGFKIRRDNGSVLTDIDAVVCDRESGALALVQLKWHDVYGRSLLERDSRRRNLAMASEWVRKMVAWIDGRSSSEVAHALGLDGHGSDRPVALYVLSRYAATFDGDSRVDDGATWLSWPELLSIIGGYNGADLLMDIPELVRRRKVMVDEIEQDETALEFTFGNLTVDLQITGPRAQ